MPAFRLNGRKAIVVKRIGFLFVQGNFTKNDMVVRQKVKIAICTADERIAGFILAVHPFLWFFIFF